MLEPRTSLNSKISKIIRFEPPRKSFPNLSKIYGEQSLDDSSSDEDISSRLHNIRINRRRGPRHVITVGGSRLRWKWDFGEWNVEMAHLSFPTL